MQRPEVVRGNSRVEVRYANLHQVQLMVMDWVIAYHKNPNRNHPVLIEYDGGRERQEVDLGSLPLFLDRLETEVGIVENADLRLGYEARIIRAGLQGIS